jgi:hypothetical protein
MKTLFFFFITFSLSAQIKGVVKDSISGEPIPYVNIWVENEAIGTTSETDGSFTLEIKGEKILVFSALGYETKRITSNIQTVVLKPKVMELKEVIVEQPKFKKKLKLGILVNLLVIIFLVILSGQTQNFLSMKTIMTTPSL